MKDIFIFVFIIILFLGILFYMAGKVGEEEGEYLADLYLKKKKIRIKNKLGKK